jgi:hypothetical protein
MSWVVIVVGIALDTLVFLRVRWRQDMRIELVWRPESGVFSWGTGQVTIPSGFTHKREHGIDTHMGLFTSRDRTTLAGVLRDKVNTTNPSE